MIEEEIKIRRKQVNRMLIVVKNLIKYL